MKRKDQPAVNTRVTREDGALASERAPLGERLRAWSDQHLYSALSSLGRLWQRRGATALTVLVMALALALPLLLQLAVANLARFGGVVREARELSVFLKPDASRGSAETLQRTIAARADVASVEVKPPDRGLDELRRLPGFAEAVQLLEENPLPTVLLVTPAPAAGPATIKMLAEAIQADATVDLVQYDLQWRERLTRALALADRTVLVIAVLLGLGALLVVGNTIRLDVQGRSEEIQIVQLLGGSDGFVRRPFLYAGCWYGLFAALAALAGAALARAALAGPVQRLAQSYGSDFALTGLDFTAVFATLAAGVMLGWIGAWAAAGRQLSKGKPA